VFRGSAFAVALLALAGCVAAPEEDPMLRRVNDLDERVGRIDRIVANQSLVQLAQRVDQLQGDVRTLNGRIEELQNANEALRKQQRDLYADIDRRISSGAAAPQPAPPAAPATPGGDEQAAYDRAFDKLKSGDSEDHRDLPVAAGRGPRGRLPDRVRAPDRLPAALPLLRHRLRLPRRQWWDIDAILAEVAGHGVRHVCVTGGEPLAQKALPQLLRGSATRLRSRWRLPAPSTSARSIRVSRVLDLKTPGSGEVARNRWSNSTC
jgi:outer membrane murein-binding lipoprotein Lpp